MITKKQLNIEHELDLFVDNAKASASEKIESHQSGRGRRANPDADLWTRQTFIIRESHLEMMRRAFYWERTTSKELLNRALSTFFKDKEYSQIPSSE